MKKCPKCGNNTFYASAHVMQDWLVDSDRNWIQTLNECVQVDHFPEDDDIWECAECRYSAAGDKFNVK